METQFIGGNDEIPMWNRDRIVETQFIGGGDEISKVEKRQLWKCRRICICDEIPMRERDKCGNAMRIAFMMKFQWERDKYSTPLNIQNPSVESRSREEKNVGAK